MKVEVDERRLRTITLEEALAAVEKDGDISFFSITGHWTPSEGLSWSGYMGGSTDGSDWEIPETGGHTPAEVIYLMLNSYQEDDT